MSIYFTKLKDQTLFLESCAAVLNMHVILQTK